MDNFKNRVIGTRDQLMKNEGLTKEQANKKVYSVFRERAHTTIQREDKELNDLESLLYKEEVSP